MLIEKIGVPATLEHMAEECTELAQACLKSARYIRNENPCFKSADEIAENLHEEVADVMVMLDQILFEGLVEVTTVHEIMSKKKKRMKERLEGMK